MIFAAAKRATYLIGLVMILAAALVFLSPSPALAACADNPTNIIPTPAGLPTVGCDGNTSKVELVMKLVFGVLAGISLLFVVIGGLKYTLSGGDSNAIASAKNTILYAVVGLVIGVSTFTIVNYLFNWLGA